MNLQRSKPVWMRSWLHHRKSPLLEDKTGNKMQGFCSPARHSPTKFERDVLFTIAWNFTSGTRTADFYAATGLLHVHGHLQLPSLYQTQQLHLSCKDGVGLLPQHCLCAVGFGRGDEAIKSVTEPSTLANSCHAGFVMSGLMEEYTGRGQHVISCK